MRKLYLYTLIGFENINGDELVIAQQMSTPSIINPMMAANGLVPLPNPLQSYCEDFNEMTECPQLELTSNSDACANNVAPIPSSP